MIPFRHRALSVLFASFFALWSLGCGSIDTTPEGDPNRVLNGVVNHDVTLPAGAEIVVRVVEPAPKEAGVRTGPSDSPAPGAAPLARAERLLGETRVVLPSGMMQPVPFRVEYLAEDAVLRRGVNVDVRVAIGGKVRYRTINAHVVTLASSPFKQEVSVQAVQ
jgi:hypothetical protein